MNARRVVRRLVLTAFFAVVIVSVRWALAASIGPPVSVTLHCATHYAEGKHAVLLQRVTDNLAARFFRERYWVSDPEHHGF